MTFSAAAYPTMARTRSSTPQFEPTQASKALKLRRVELGKSQADVAFDSEALTQTTVSELERGKYGPEDLTAARLAALAKGLNWTVSELEHETGLDLGLTTTVYQGKPEILPVTYDSSGQPYAVAPRRPRRIPPELEQMIDEKSALAPELADERWQQYLAGQRFSTGSASAERWWNLYLLLKSANVEPGGN